MKRFSFVAVLVLLAAGGCACQNPNNTPLLTTLDRQVAPETTTAKLALAPVFVPVGAVAGALDIAVLHPVHSIWLAGEDTWQALWAKPSGGLGEQLLLAVPKAAVSPITFGLSWIAESFFDLRGMRERRETP